LYIIRFESSNNCGGGQIRLQLPLAQSGMEQSGGRDMDHQTPEGEDEIAGSNRIKALKVLSGRPELERSCRRDGGSYDARRTTAQELRCSRLPRQSPLQTRAAIVSKPRDAGIHREDNPETKPPASIRSSGR